MLIVVIYNDDTLEILMVVDTQNKFTIYNLDKRVPIKQRKMCSDAKVGDMNCKKVRST